jgi:hypothetical protein
MRLCGKPARIAIRVFDVGVVDVAIRVRFQAASLLDLHPLHAPKLEEDDALDTVAQRLCAEVTQSIRDSLVRAAPPSVPEAYTIFILSELDGETDVGAWYGRHVRDVAGLLTETAPETLSDEQVDEAHRIRRSYATSDLVVIHWDSALVIDLEGYAEDVLYVLELANLQLEEFRVMDARLDMQLDRAYADLEETRGVRRRHGPMLEWLRRFRVDLTQLADQVTNITKFFGDWHLARIYLGAAERFHLQEWRRSVDGRLSHLDQVYQVLQSEVYERRMLWLEVAIVVCFVVDLLAIFFWKT